jgi:hypothetical protein
MLGELVRRHAQQQHAAERQVNFGTVRFGNQGIRGLLDSVVKEFVGVLAAEDEPYLDGFPERRIHLFVCLPLNQDQSGDVNDIAQAGEVFRASCVVADNRFSFPAMRSTTLSV